ncbi:MAG: hypothetical protein A2096_05765 [Spirochaetes bacterium GWF1_41_5]|nr:MAG: hypothetical protein A2096_05765 [Spirochaetes bacterium GWF1_41_5]HBE04772.1 hypothetical protein [Spirochaetia bacterium]
MIEFLKKIDLFSHLDNNELENFTKKGQILPVSFKKGQYLIQEGAKYNSLHISIKGICMAEMGDITGKTIKIDEFKPPHIIGIGFFFSDKNILPVSIKAKTNLQIIKISRQAIFNLCKSDEIFLNKFLLTLSSRIEFLTQRIRFLNFNTIRQKLANYLLILAGGKENSLTLPLKMHELADYFGVARPSLSQVFIDFINEGILSRNKKKIIINRREKLLAVCNN